MLTLAYMNEEALRAHARERRGPLLQPLARGALAQGRDLGQRPAAARSCATTATRDAVLALVEPAGPACHTGERTCFYRSTSAATAAAPSTRRCLRSSARSPSAARACPRAATRASSSTTRARSAPRSRRRRRRWLAPAGRSPTSGFAEEAADLLYHLAALMLDAAASRCARRARRAQRRGATAERRAPTAPDPSPSLDEARELAREHNVIPLRHTFIDDYETPVSAFLKLRGAGPAFLLESAEQGQRFGRYSFLGFRPRADAALERRRAREWRGERARRRPSCEREHRSLGAVADYLADYQVAPVEGLPPFAGGAVGLFGYDLVRTVEPLREPNPDPVGLPDMALMVSDALIVFDHLSHEVTMIANAFVDDEGGIEAAYERAAAAIARASRAARGAGPRAVPRRPSPRPPRFESNMTQEQFEANVARIVEYIYAGDAFQVVPSQRFSGAGSGRGVLDLPRPARREPLARTCTSSSSATSQIAGASPEPLREGHRRPGRDAADRRHLPARRRPRRRTAATPRSCSPTRRSAPST